MAKKRKPLSQKIRFEVFKRDGFKCQYCGRSLPEVTLEVDHIVPVAEGGENDIMNLVTSCRECNRGKGKTLLDDETILKKQKAELEELNEKRNQMEMMIKWRSELRGMEMKQVESISEAIADMTGYIPDEQDKAEILRVLKNYSFIEVCKATDISFERYYLRCQPFWTDSQQRRCYSEAIKKIGGVCYNRRKQGQV